MSTGISLEKNLPAWKVSGVFKVQQGDQGGWNRVSAGKNDRHPRAISRRAQKPTYAFGSCITNAVASCLLLSLSVF